MECAALGGGSGVAGVSDIASPGDGMVVGIGSVVAEEEVEVELGTGGSPLLDGVVVQHLTDIRRAAKLLLRSRDPPNNIRDEKVEHRIIE